MVRSPALVVLLLLASCTSSAERAAQRPKGAATGSARAQVLIASGPQGGMPQIRDVNGKVFEAGGGMQLLSNDVMLVGAHSFLLLELLPNHQVVRIDEDLDMRVADIALLDAPAVAESSVTSQLERLLTREDRTNYQTRMIGWHVSPIAANVPSIRSERQVNASADEPAAPPPMEEQAVAKAAPSLPRSLEKKREKKKEEPKPVAPPPPAESPAPATRPPAAPGRAPASKEQTRTVPGGTGGEGASADQGGFAIRGDGSGDQGGSRDRIVRKRGESGGSGGKQVTEERRQQRQNTAAPLRDEPDGDDAEPGTEADEVKKPTEAGSPFDDALLEGCLNELVAAYGPAVKGKLGDELDVTFRVRDGRLEVRLEGALPVPPCAQSFLRVHQAELGATERWQTRRVRLK